MSEKSEFKRKFRATKTWKVFRLFMKNKYRVDYITQKPLSKMFNLHHCDLHVENYTNLDEAHFKCLGNSMHDVVHTMYRYYRKDRKCIDRLKEVLDLMVELSEDEPLPEDKQLDLFGV